jgi:hypothetical protein
MIETIVNLCAIFVVFWVVVVSIVFLVLSFFILFASVYIGWKEIRGMALCDIWDRVTK